MNFVAMWPGRFGFVVLLGAALVFASCGKSGLKRLPIRPDGSHVITDGGPDLKVDGGPDSLADAQPDIRPDAPPDIRPDTPPDIRPDVLMDIRPDAQLIQLVVGPSPVTAAVGTTIRFFATARYADGAQADVTSACFWRSRVPMVADVRGGTAVALSPGSTQIWCDFGGASSFADLTVTGVDRKLVAVSIEPAMSVMPARTQATLAAIGLYSDGSRTNVTAQAQWRSDNPMVVSSLGSGLIAALNEGGATITATFEGITGAAFVNVVGALPVTLTVQPGFATTPVGTQVSFTAVATLSDGRAFDVTAFVTWEWNDPSVAVAVGPGVFQALRPGSTTVLARYQNLVASARLEVTGARLISLEVFPPDVRVGVGAVVAFQAIGTYSDGSRADLTSSARWSSSNPAIIPIDLGRGIARSPGSATILAEVSNVAAKAQATVLGATLQSIVIRPDRVDMTVMQRVGLQAFGTLSDGTTVDLTSSVTWQAAPDGVVVVSNAVGSSGLMTAVGTGRVVVTATLSGLTANCFVTVSSAMPVSLKVVPDSAVIPTGSSQTLQAVAVFSDGSTRDVTTEVFWASSDASVASVSNVAGAQGRVSGVRAGDVTVTAVWGMQAVGTAKISVVAATLQTLTVTPASATTTVGLRVSYLARGTYSDGSTAILTDQVTWSVADPAVATISNAAGAEGLLVARGAGSTSVVATLGMLTASATLTVRDLAPSRLSITPAGQTRTTGAVVAFTATLFFNDGTSRNVTNEVIWASSDQNIAFIDPFGVAVAGNPGTATITASYPGFTATTTLRVMAPVPTALRVLPSTATIGVGQVVQFTLEATYSDGTVRIIFDGVMWSSDNAMSLVVIAPNGVVRAASPGRARLSALFMGMSAFADVTVL